MAILRRRVSGAFGDLPPLVQQGGQRHQLESLCLYGIEPGPERPDGGLPGMADGDGFPFPPGHWLYGEASVPDR